MLQGQFCLFVEGAVSGALRDLLDLLTSGSSLVHCCFAGREQQSHDPNPAAPLLVASAGPPSRREPTPAPYRNRVELGKAAWRTFLLHYYREA